PGFHRAFPWSEARWRFVLARLREKCAALHEGEGLLLHEGEGPLLHEGEGPLLHEGEGPLLHEGDASAWHAAGIALHGRETRNPGYREAMAGFEALSPVPRRFGDPETLCRSFSRFWKLVGPAGGGRLRGMAGSGPPPMKAR